MNNVTKNNEAQELTAFEIGALLQTQTNTDIDTIHMIVKRIIDTEKALKNAETWIKLQEEEMAKLKNAQKNAN